MSPETIADERRPTKPPAPVPDSFTEIFAAQEIANIKHSMTLYAIDLHYPPNHELRITCLRSR